MKGHVFCYKTHLSLQLQESRVEGVKAGTNFYDIMVKRIIAIHVAEIYCKGKDLNNKSETCFSRQECFPYILKDW